MHEAKAELNCPAGRNASRAVISKAPYMSRTLGSVLLVALMAASSTNVWAMRERSAEGRPTKEDNDVGLYFDVATHSSTFNGVRLDPDSDANPGLFQDPVFFAGFSCQQNFNISDWPSLNGNDVFFRADIRFGGVNIETTDKSAASGGFVKVGEEILRNTKSLELGVDIFFNWRDVESAPVALFSSVRLRGYSPTGETDPNDPTSDLLAERAIFPIGMANKNVHGPFNGSYFQAGIGRSDRFLERTRYLADAYALVGPSDEDSYWKFFIEFNVSLDADGGSDEVRATFGIHYDLAGRIRSWEEMRKKAEEE